MNNNSHVLGSFLDVSKAFDKVLHNGLFKKLLDRNVPACLVLLLKYWDGHLQCAVRWCNVLDNWFPILSGVRQGGVLSFFSQWPSSHWVQSMHRVASSFRNLVASLLISLATTEKSDFYFSDSPFWFSGTMPSYCMTVLWRRRSKVHPH